MFLRIIFVVLMGMVCVFPASAELSPKAKAFIEKFEDGLRSEQKRLPDDVKQHVADLKLFVNEIVVHFDAGKCLEAIDTMENRYLSEDEYQADIGRATIAYFVISEGSEALAGCKLPVYIALPALIDSYAAINHVTQEFPGEVSRSTTIFLGSGPIN